MVVTTGVPVIVGLQGSQGASFHRLPCFQVRQYGDFLLVFGPGIVLMGEFSLSVGYPSFRCLLVEVGLP